jgi:glycosyltransferase involved in cell wall biosynthesis
VTAQAQLIRRTPNTRNSRTSGLNIGVISTYLPRICGIATFSGDLVRALRQGFSPPAVSVVAMKSPGEKLTYPFEVVSEIRQDARLDYFDAADALNRRHLDAVSLQHEFGIYGGADGALVLEFMARLNAPIISTLHTVLQQPSDHQREVLRRVAELSARVVVMSEMARRFLVDIYGVPAGRITVIRHGVPAQDFSDSRSAKERVGLSGRNVILTFGLLSQNKGIEYMLRAMPAIAKLHPRATYVVLGTSHPLAVNDEGEPYVAGLKRIVHELDLEQHVTFIPRFVAQEELCAYLGAADVYVTPYVNEDQITSGTLSYALGCGTAAVSTPYWHAQELLADGRGHLVPFRDSAALGHEVSSLLGDDLGREHMRRRAYEYSRGAVWEEVGRSYVALVESLSGRRSSALVERDASVA